MTLVLPYDPTKKTLPKAARHPESKVKETLRPTLGLHFDFREEVTGLGPDGQKVKIDFWCHPNARVIRQGWPDRWFGLEVKGYGFQDQRKKAACRLLYQAIIYRNSVFPVNGESVRPDMVLVYPSFSTLLFDEERHAVYGNTFEDGYALALAKEAGMHRVGELMLLTSTDIAVYAHGLNCWYRTRWGRADIDYFGVEDNHASR